MTDPLRPYRRPEPKLPLTPLWFKLWFAFCATVGVAFLGLIAWAIVAIVEKVTR